MEIKLKLPVIKVLQGLQSQKQGFHVTIKITMLYMYLHGEKLFPTSPGIKDYVPPEAKIPGIHGAYFTKPGSGFGSKSLSDHIILL